MNLERLTVDTLDDLNRASAATFKKAASGGRSPAQELGTIVRNGSMGGYGRMSAARP